MTNDQCESPPLSETNGVVNSLEGHVVNDSVRSSHQSMNTTLTDANSTLEISYDKVPLKFTKSNTTDDIVNVDADLIEFDSFQYVKKETLIKALIYMIKNVNDIDKDLSSVTVPIKTDTGCQFNGCCDADSETSAITTTQSFPSNQVDQLNVILKNFQSSLLKSVDDKLSVVDNKISDAISNLSNDTHIKSFSEAAAKAAKNVETIAQCTISNVENVAKQSIDIVNAKTTSVPQYVDIASTNIDLTNSSKTKSSEIFVSNSVVLNTPDSINADVMVLNPVNPRTTYIQSKLDNVKNSLRDKLKKVPFEFANEKSKTGNIAIRFPNILSYNEAEKLIDTTFLASINYESKKGKKMLPKITLKGVPSYLIRNINVSNMNESQIFDAKKQELTSLIRDKNPCIDSLVTVGHTFQIVFISTHSNGNDLTIGIKVSPLIRSTILSEQNGYLFIGSKRCLFNDRFNVGQCYHCQHLGHTSQNCGNKDSSPTCLYCMGSHRSNSCIYKNQIDQHCCAKCHESTNDSEVQNCRSHNSASPDCPVYIRECQRLANITDFSSKNIL